MLISAGVGVTPLLAMLNTLTSSSSSSASTTSASGKRKITWIQGSRNSVEQPFATHVRNVVKQSEGRVKAVVFHSRPGKEEKRDVDFDFEGYVDLEKVRREELFLNSDTRGEGEGEGAEYYICGPVKVSFCSLM